MFDDEDEDDEIDEEPPAPCSRCGKPHVAVFSGERYSTFDFQGPIAGVHRNFFSQSSARLMMRTCMDCGYIELYHEELMRQDD
ncbi:MAG: hypothetical protein ACR2M0_07290 [Chloroflexia bacterium]